MEGEGREGDARERRGEIDRNAGKPTGFPAQPYMFSWFKTRSQVNSDLSVLRQRCDVLERDFKRVELDWSDMYDRLRRVLMKISRRQQREDEREDTLRVEGENGAGGSATAVPSTLSARQLELNQRILNRRGRIPQKGGE